MCGYTRERFYSFTWVRKSLEESDIPKIAINGVPVKYMMLLSSKTGREGNIASLIAPFLMTDHELELTFFLYSSLIGSSSATSSQSTLTLMLSKCRMRSYLLYKAKAKANTWTKHSVILPAGEYDLIFRGTMGTEQVSDLALAMVNLKIAKGNQSSNPISEFYVLHL